MEILLYIENRHFLELSYERLDHQARINHDSFVYGFQNQNLACRVFCLRTCGGGTVYIWGSVLFCLDVLVRTFYSVATYKYLAQILFYSGG